MYLESENVIFVEYSCSVRLIDLILEGNWVRYWCFVCEGISLCGLNFWSSSTVCLLQLLGLATTRKIFRIYSYAVKISFFPVSTFGELIYDFSVYNYSNPFPRMVISSNAISPWIFFSKSILPNDCCTTSIAECLFSWTRFAWLVISTYNLSFSDLVYYLFFDEFIYLIVILRVWYWGPIFSMSREKYWKT